MRDPERIPKMLAELDECWQLNPDLRLGQLLCIAADYAALGAIGILFYTEDDELLKGLRAFAERTQQARATPSSESPAIPVAGSSPSSDDAESEPPPSPRRSST